MMGKSASNPAKGVLFDLDGTLLDTADDLGNALNHVLIEHGLQPCNAEIYRQAASHGSIALLKVGFGKRLGEFDLIHLRQQFLDYYQNNICVDTRLFSGIEDLLLELKRRLIPWGIVTNKPQSLTEKLLPFFKCLTESKVNVSGDTLKHSKPHPAPMQLAAKSLNIVCEDIWYVGDAERDMQAANQVAMTSILAKYGYISEYDQPQHWNADIEIDTPNELIHLLK
jgi:2-phosphoglycolate phosphatase